MSGSCTSQMMRSGRWRRAACSPWWPSVAVSAVCPKAPRRYVISSRLVGLSSMMRMLAATGGISDRGGPGVPLQGQGERAALAELALQGDLPAEHLGELAAQVQP